MCCSSIAWWVERCWQNWRPVLMNCFRDIEDGRLLLVQAPYIRFQVWRK